MAIVGVLSVQGCGRYSTLQRTPSPAGRGPHTPSPLGRSLKPPVARQGLSPAPALPARRYRCAASCAASCPVARPGRSRAHLLMAVLFLLLHFLVVGDVARVGHVCLEFLRASLTSPVAFCSLPSASLASPFASSSGLLSNAPDPLLRCADRDLDGACGLILVHEMSFEVDGRASDWIVPSAHFALLIFRALTSDKPTLVGALSYAGARSRHRRSSTPQSIVPDNTP